MTADETVIDPGTLEPVTEGVQQALNEFQQEGPPLSACPCGQVPKTLLIEVPPRAKYGRVSADCCGEWHLEFKAGLNKTPQEVANAAKDTWTAAPRGEVATG